MAKLTPVEGNPFGETGAGVRLTPVDGNPFGADALTPEEQQEYDSALFRIQQKRAAPHVPNSAVESDLKLTPEQEAMEAVKAFRQKGAEQQADASRTLGDRAVDAAGFVASLPVRMATKGDYGLADVAALVGERPEFADQLRQAEAGFVQNNQAGLEAAQAFGDVTAGIPVLSTMGAVPGQLLRTMAAAGTRRGGTEASGRTAQEIAQLQQQQSQLPRAARVQQDVVMPESAGTQYAQQPFKGGGDDAMAELARIQAAKVARQAADEVPPPAAVPAAASPAKGEIPVYDSTGKVSHYIDEAGNLRPPTEALPTSLVSIYNRHGEGIFRSALANMDEADLHARMDRQGFNIIPGASRDELIEGALKQVKDRHEARVAFASGRQSYDSADMPQPKPLQQAMSQGPEAPAGGGGGQLPPASSSSPPPMGPRPPARQDVIEAAQRIEVPLMRAMMGNRVERDLAGGLSAIPYAGSPISNAFERGQQALGDASARATSRLGNASEMAGENTRRSLENWLRVGSKDQETALYKDLEKLIPAATMRPLTSTVKEVADMSDDMTESTSKTLKPAIEMVKEATEREGGLTFRGALKLRTDVGAKLDEIRISGQGGTEIPGFKRVYKALSKDIEDMARQAGGEEAVEAFRRANRTVDELNDQRKEIEGVIGPTGRASEGQVTTTIERLLTSRGSDVNRVRIIRRAMGEEAWGNQMAEITRRWGLDTSAGADPKWSHNRFLSAYGKLSDEGKSEALGSAKPMFDDIATVSGKFKELEKLGNSSGTGRVNAVIKLITDPKALFGVAAGVTPFAPGLAAVGGASTLAGFAAGRRVAWYLAQDVTKSQARAGRLIKSYYGVESAVKKGGAALARNEVELSASIRSFAQSLADETGEAADDIERRLLDSINEIRQAKGGKSALVDTMMNGTKTAALSPSQTERPELLRAMAAQTVA
jgi:hypothetical protein